MFATENVRRAWDCWLAIVLAANLVSANTESILEPPFVVVLGVAQDGGLPQTAQHADAAWEQPEQRRHVVSLGLVDPAQAQRWMFEATPDFKYQLHALDKIQPRRPALPDGIFITHAHIGHYTGLMFLGHESAGARGVPVFVMPRMRAFLEGNGPWSQLVRYDNIALQSLASGQPVRLNERLTVTPFLVPHRQEFSEVVGYRIDGPSRSALFIPDIDSWEQLDAQGMRIEALISEVDAAFLDGTFYANGEIPGRDMTGFPHPFVRHSLQRFSSLPAAERVKIFFIHLNHTNPVARDDSDARQQLEAAGFGVSSEGQRVPL